MTNAPRALPESAAEPDLIDRLVNRFLWWRLPHDFSPDCGINFDGRKDDEWNKDKTWPVGTNLLTADQARAMFEHVLEGTPMPDWTNYRQGLEDGKRLAMDDALAAPQEPASPAAPVDCPPYSAGPLLERGWDMAACDAAAEVLQRRDQPYYAQLDAIGSVIGYGRAKQILQELWDAMLERKYPK